MTPADGVPYGIDISAQEPMRADLTAHDVLADLEAQLA